MSRRVLLIGWDAADWKVIHPLMDAGAMPNLQSLVNRGCMGDISTIHPVLSPMLWTSIATGKRPYKHGVWGFVEPTPDGMNVQPISVLNRKTKAIWNILGQSGYKSNVVGWWPSHPAEPINGVMVSDNFHRVLGENNGKWPLLPESIYPQRCFEELAALRVHPSELTEHDLLPFIPSAGKVDQEKDQRMSLCLRTMAECCSIHSAATHLMETEDWDFTAVYYDAIDHFSHGFMRYHPPKNEWVSDGDFEVYQHVVRSAYVFHDMMLGRLLQLAGDEATVILMSDHGFHSDQMRPRNLPLEPAGPAAEHRDFGIFVMAGPGIKKDELVYGTSILDITPTVLQLFGLPVGEDMDGRVTVDVFEQPASPETIESWDSVEGDDGCHPPEATIDPVDSQQSLQQLVDLGYVEPLSQDRAKNVQKAIRELNYNLARSYMDAERHSDALPLLNELYQANPGEYRFGIQLAMCLRALEQIDAMTDVVERLNQRRNSDAQNARESLQEYRKIALQRLKESPNVGERDEEFLVNSANSDAGFPSLKLFSEDEQKEIRELIAKSSVNQSAIDFLTGYVELARGRSAEALRSLQKAAAVDSSRPGLQIQIGEAYMKLRDWAKAKQAFGRAMEIDSVNPHALLGLARCHFRLQRFERAAEFALDSINQMFFHPSAHYWLGYSCWKTNRPKQALAALQLATSQNPNFAQAHRLIARIYRSAFQDQEMAGLHDGYYLAAKQETQKYRSEKFRLAEAPKNNWNDEILANRVVREKTSMVPSIKEMRGPTREADSKKIITVVSGVPRSGTSMMMRMLTAGGIEPYFDECRKSNEDNPHGYFELEPVKKLSRCNDWLDLAKGKSLKVIAQLIEWLPAEFGYRFVFMQRHLDEVIRSQKVMLQNRGRSGALLTEDQLKRHYQRNIQETLTLLSQKQLPVIVVPYRQAIDSSEQVVQSIIDFLPHKLAAQAMLDSIDRKLYRQRVQ